MVTVMIRKVASQITITHRITEKNPILQDGEPIPGAYHIVLEGDNKNDDTDVSDIIIELPDDAEEVEE